MASKNQSLLFLMLFPVALFSYMVVPSLDFNSTTSQTSEEAGGRWELLYQSIGLSAMHMQVLKNNKVVIFDRTDMGPSNATLPDAKTDGGRNCPLTYTDEANKTIPDCTAHSLIYDIASNSFRPLLVRSDTFCSSGAVNTSGNLIQTGGYGEGNRRIRIFSPCDDEICDWVEHGENLTQQRWYATNQLLPDGGVIVVGGRRVFSYEYVPKTSPSLLQPTSSPGGSHFLAFLMETRDRYEENNLYPFLHLLPDGNLFIFANKKSILLDYKINKIVKTFPVMPGNDKRNYPSTGSSVLLPLKLAGLGLPESEILICGGAPPGAYIKSNLERIFLPASRTCGRIRVSEPDPKWTMEVMPMPRVMSDMLLLPTGDVIIINGASNGTGGWEDAVNPVYNPVLYKPEEQDPGRRFSVLNPTSIPRMYHSSAVLLPDGRILVGGSNPHAKYNFTDLPYPTDLSLEAFSPPYLDPHYNVLRPSIIAEGPAEKIVPYGQMFSITILLTVYRLDPQISVVLIAPSFSTHSLAMNQRMLVLGMASMEIVAPFTHMIKVGGPLNANVAPPGYYMLFVVYSRIPSKATWVKVQ